MAWSAEASSPRESPLPLPAEVPTHWCVCISARCGARAHHLPALASEVSRSTDGTLVGVWQQAREDRRAGRVAVRLGASHRRQRPDSGAPGDAKMPPMVSAVQPSANVCCSRERAEGFQTRTIDIGKARDSNWSDEEDIGVQRARILAASKGSPRSKKSGSRRSPLMA